MDLMKRLQDAERRIVDIYRQLDKIEIVASTPVTGELRTQGGGAITPALKAITDSAGTATVLQIGTTAIDNYGAGGAATNSTAFGTNALDSATGTSYGNIAIGFNVLTALTVSSYNVGVGPGAFTSYNDLDGSGTKGQNTAIGAFALYALGAGKWNTALGSSAMQNTGAASWNVVIGAHAGENMSGSNNITLGVYAGIATSGSNNIQLKTDAAQSGVTTGSDNIIISKGLTGVTTGSGNVIIGNVTGVAAAAANNIYIGNGAGSRARFDGTNWNFTGQINKVALDTAPASAVAAGVLGEIRFTATHVYLCTAANTWVRAALATW